MPPSPRKLTAPQKALAATAMRAMSIYRTFDDGPLSEVSVQQVDIKRVRQAPVQPPPSLSDAAYASMRKAQPPAKALPVTWAWAARLPPHVRPMQLLHQYPRVANALAASWAEPHSFRACLYELLVDRRGNRRGFPQRVQAELLALRAYFESSCL
jgi:hypothetical protein